MSLLLCLQDLVKFMDRVTTVLEEKVRCDQKGEVYLMRDTDVKKNPHLQALSFRAKGLLKMAKHNLGQISGPSDKPRSVKPVATVLPAPAVVVSPAPATSASPHARAPKPVAQVVHTPAPTVTTSSSLGAKPTVTVSDSAVVTFDRLQAAFQKFEEDRVANTAAALLAKVRRKTSDLETEPVPIPNFSMVEVPATTGASATAVSNVVTSQTGAAPPTLAVPPAQTTTVSSAVAPVSQTGKFTGMLARAGKTKVLSLSHTCRIDSNLSTAEAAQCDRYICWRLHHRLFLLYL